MVRAPPHQHLGCTCDDRGGISADEVPCQIWVSSGHVVESGQNPKVVAVAAP